MSIGSRICTHRGVFIAISAIAAMTLVVGCMPEKKTDEELAKLSKADAGTSAPTDAGGGGSTTPADTSGGGSSTTTDTGGGGSTTPADTSGGSTTKKCSEQECLASHPNTPPCGAWACENDACKQIWKKLGESCKANNCQVSCACVQTPKKKQLTCLPPKPPGKGG